MSELWNQSRFEQLLKDDSLVFGDESFLSEAIDWDVQYPPAPEEPIQVHQDYAHQAEKQSPSNWTCQVDTSTYYGSPVRAFTDMQEIDEATLPTATRVCSPLSRHPLVAERAGLTGPALPQQSANSRPRTVVQARVRAFRCNEPDCFRWYARKGDLARHKREEHSDAEYLCPYSDCLWHRNGHGFKRMHRLASHLFRPSRKDYSHPRALTRLDAKYIAVDYNDGLVSQGMLSFSSEMRDSSGNEEVVDARGRRYGELDKYTQRLEGVHCPQAGCLVFCLDSAAPDFYGLRKHLQRKHKIEWRQAFAIAVEAGAAQRDRGRL